MRNGRTIFPCEHIQGKILRDPEDWHVDSLTSVALSTCWVFRKRKLDVFARPLLRALEIGDDGDTTMASVYAAYITIRIRPSIRPQIEPPQSIIALALSCSYGSDDPSI